MRREIEYTRETGETSITAKLALDGEGRAQVKTGLGFLDHMLGTLTKHAGMDLELTATGDLHTDDHHTVEDCAIVLGRALDDGLEDRSGIVRFGSAYAPLDESLCRSVIDLSGRGWPEIHIPFSRDMVGDVATENLKHFLASFAIEARMALHVDLIRGQNNHHMAEAAFKSLALALRQAVARTGTGVPSTKGMLR